MRVRVSLKSGSSFSFSKSGSKGRFLRKALIVELTLTQNYSDRLSSLLYFKDMIIDDRTEEHLYVFLNSVDLSWSSSLLNTRSIIYHNGC